MGIDYNAIAQAGGIGKGRPRVLDQHRKRRERDAALEAAYATVDTRDKSICRVTGRTLKPGAVDPRQRREHHHLSGRRVKPEWRHDPRRIITVAADVHECLQRHLIEVEGDDANTSLRFWWNLPKGETPPFDIISRRKSQRRTA